MPTIEANGCPIHVEIEGPEGAPTLMLSNSLGTDLHMWDPQMPAFTQHFRVIRYDRRGHGKSGATSGAYTMEQLGRDVLAIMDALKVQKTHWCGLSIGGMVGMWLGVNAPERFDRMILSNTGPFSADKAGWNDRMAAVQAKGMSAIANGTMERWFTEGFRQREPQVIEDMKVMLGKTSVDGYVGAASAVRDMDHREIVKQITAPTLVIMGRDDLAIPLAAGEYLRDNIKGSKLVVLEASHIANIEQPQAYTEAALNHLRG